MLSIDDGDNAVQQVMLAYCFFNKEGLGDWGGISQPCSFNNHALEMELTLFTFFCQFAEDANQIATYGTTDTAVVHFHDLFFALE